jgi:hypothetical protein
LLLLFPLVCPAAAAAAVTPATLNGTDSNCRLLTSWRKAVCKCLPLLPQTLLSLLCADVAQLALLFKVSRVPLQNF